MEESLEEQDIDAIMIEDSVKPKEKPKLKNTSAKALKAPKDKIEKVGGGEPKLKIKNNLTNSQPQPSNEENCIVSQANTKHKKSKIVYVASKKDEK